jgi:hypothetical protein
MIEPHVAGKAIFGHWFPVEGAACSRDPDPMCYSTIQIVRTFLRSIRTAFLYTHTARTDYICALWRVLLTRAADLRPAGCLSRLGITRHVRPCCREIETQQILSRRLPYPGYVIYRSCRTITKRCFKCEETSSARSDFTVAVDFLTGLPRVATPHEGPVRDHIASTLRYNFSCSRRGVGRPRMQRGARGWEDPRSVSRNRPP